MVGFCSDNVLEKQAEHQKQQLLTFDGELISQPGLIKARLDDQCRYVSATRYSAELCGFDSVDQMSGCTVFDFRCPTVEQAATFYQQDKTVLASGLPMSIFSINHYANGELICLFTSKQCLRSEEGVVIGLETHCQPLLESEFTSFAAHLFQYAIYLYKKHRFTSLSYELVDAYKSMGLTAAESVVLFLLAHGKSASQIAEIRSKSVRTIETQIESVKLKLNLTKKSDLIEFALFSGAAQKLPRELVGC